MSVGKKDYADDERLSGMHTGRKMLENDALAYPTKPSPSKDYNAGADTPKKDFLVTHKEGGKPETIIIDKSLEKEQNFAINPSSSDAEKIITQ